MTTDRRTTQDCIDRLNFLSEQPAHVRDALRQECAVRGHDPSGERFLTMIPILSCFRCGAEYQETQSKSDA